jgi:hypothetical protein
MIEQDLPAPVARAIEAVNAGDTEAFLSESRPTAGSTTTAGNSADTMRCALGTIAS